MRILNTRIFRALVLLAGLSTAFSTFALAPLSADQSTELRGLYKAYSVDNQAAVAVRKQVENLQTEIVTQKAFATELKSKADRAETKLSDLQEFDRKQPGTVKPEELDAARSKHLQARADAEASQRLLAQLQNKLTQLKEDLAKKNLVTEHSLMAYQARFEVLAKETVTRRVNALKVPQQITESASIPCEDLALKDCKIKTQQEVQRRAIEKGAIIVVDSVTEIKNLKLEKDEVKSEVHGEISNLKILDTKLTDEPATYAMKIQATVTPAIGNSLLVEINRTVKADMSLQVGDGGLANYQPERNELPDEEQSVPAIENSLDETNKGESFDSRLMKAKKGDTQAQYDIALMYDFGFGVQQDHQKAFEWYSKAATKGHVIAQAGLARAYAVGWGVKEDCAKSRLLTSNALPALEKLAAADNSAAQFELHGIYGIGCAVEKNNVKAFEFLEKAALQDNVIAQHTLGSKYRYGWMGASKNEAYAFQLYEKAADQGYATAQYSLGRMYEDGIGVEKDEHKAFEWIQKAALQGDTSAQYSLGTMYQDGIGVENNKYKAFEWYEKASLQPNGDSSVCLKAVTTIAILLSDARSAEEDKDYFKASIGNSEATEWAKHAVSWCERAALGGDGTSQYELAWMFFSGVGTSKNIDKAYKWFEKAAMQGQPIAQAYVGGYYRSGAVVGKDLVLAYAWLNLAAANGYADAAKDRDEIKLTASQVAEAERLSSEWKPGKPMRRLKK